MLTDVNNLSSTNSGTSTNNVLTTSPTSVQATTTSDPYGFNSTSSPSASSFQTLAQGNANLEVVTPDSSIVQNRMVFSTVNEEVRTPKTLTLRNTGTAPLTITSLNFNDSLEKDNAVRLTDHTRGSDFRFVNSIKLPITIAANESMDVAVQFAPQRNSTVSATTTHLLNGENYASLTITSDDPDQPTTNVNLAGVNFAFYGGNREPSLAEMARTFGWTLNTGTENIIYGGAKAPFGDEVYSPYWLRANASKPVELWSLAVTSSPKDTPHGRVSFDAKPGSGGNSGFIYEFAGRLNDDSPTGKEVLGSNNTSGGENQKLLPKIFINGVSTEQTIGNVSFNPTKAFALNNSGSSTDDNRNGTGKLHNWRMFPVRDAKGSLIPDTWFATQDIGNTEGGFKNYDFNDHVYLLKNAKPESASRDPSIGGLFPGSPDLVFDFNKTYTGSLTDKDGQTIGFTSTQLNKNDTFATKVSHDPSLLDIDPNLGTLSVTTTAGSNGANDNTLVNGLQTTFDGRAAKSIISTRLLGSLGNMTAPNQQAGLMFGPDQDNYLKLVARVQSNGTLGLQFFSERKGLGTTIASVGSVGPFASPSTLQSLDLMLVNDPRTGTVQAAYRAISATQDTGIVTLPSSLQLKGGQVGQYFAAQSKAGIITSSKGSTPITLTFDSFGIASGETTSAHTALHRIDVGSSSAYTDSATGNVWSADTGLFDPPDAPAENGGTPAPAIANTVNDKLYQTYRGRVNDPSRMITFNLPIDTPGKVDVRLHFAELYWGAPGKPAGGAGKRIFDIGIEGVNVLDNFDITAASGGALRSVVVPIEGIQVNDGVLNIQFKAEVNFASLAGIEVLV